MERRKFLIGGAVVSLPAVAGCMDSSSDDDGTNGLGDGGEDSGDDDSGSDDTESNGSDDDSTGDESKDENGGNGDDDGGDDDEGQPAEPKFTDVSVDIPEEVEINEEWKFSLSVTNEGDADGTYETTVHVAEAGNQYEKLGDIELEVEAGEKATFESDPGQTEYITRIDWFFEESGIERQVQVVSASLSVGETYRNPNGIEITVTDIDLQNAYTYEDWQGDEVTEPASDGSQWAFVWLEATNDSGSSESLPWKNSIDIISDKQQYGHEWIQKEDGEYESDEVRDGITREGWIAYDIDEQYATSDLEVWHSDNNFDGDWEVTWRM